MKNITTFEITENDSGLLVSKKRNGHIIMATYALNKKQAEEIRTSWVNDFWGFPQLNYN